MAQRRPDLPGVSIAVDQSHNLMEAQKALDNFFLTPRRFYFESEINSLAAILKRNGMHDWSQVPKLYFILRCVGRQDLISTFVSHGFNDASIPVENNVILSLVENAASDSIARFNDYQKRVQNHGVEIYEAALAKFFTPDVLTRERPVGDSEFSEIARLLQFCGNQEAAESPKLYFVLRSIDELGSLPTFRARGYSDVWFPFPKHSLSAGLFQNSVSKESFSTLQKLVYSNRWSENVHMNFGDDEDVFIDHRRELGEGGTGEVDHVYCFSFGKEYARKRVLRSTQGLRYFSNEIAVLRTVSHRHCVSLACSYTDPHYLAILCHPVADMNLATLLEAGLIPDDRKALLQSSFGCLSIALQYLHGNDIIHKDIKPQNILIHGNRLLLTDFGLSADEVGNSTTTASKTMRYSAPEVEDGVRRNFTSDVWALGCVFLEILGALCGYTIGKVKDYFRNHGEKRINFNANLSAMESFLIDVCHTEMLQQYGMMAIMAKALTPTMVCRDPKNRPMAESIVAGLSSAIQQQNAFYGRCCRDEMERIRVQQDGYLEATPFREPSARLKNSPQVSEDSHQMELTDKDLGMQNTSDKSIATPTELLKGEIIPQEVEFRDPFFPIREDGIDINENYANSDNGTITNQSRGTLSSGGRRITGTDNSIDESGTTGDETIPSSQSFEDSTFELDKGRSMQSQEISETKRNLLEDFVTTKVKLNLIRRKFARAERDRDIGLAADLQYYAIPDCEQKIESLRKSMSDVGMYTHPSGEKLLEELTSEKAKLISLNEELRDAERDGKYMLAEDLKYYDIPFYEGRVEDIQKSLTNFGMGTDSQPSGEQAQQAFPTDEDSRNQIHKNEKDKAPQLEDTGDSATEDDLWDRMGKNIKKKDKEPQLEDTRNSAAEDDWWSSVGKKIKKKKKKGKEPQPTGGDDSGTELWDPYIASKSSISDYGKDRIPIENTPPIFDTGYHSQGGERLYLSGSSHRDNQNNNLSRGSTEPMEPSLPRKPFRAFTNAEDLFEEFFSVGGSSNSRSQNDRKQDRPRSPGPSKKPVKKPVDKKEYPLNQPSQHRWTKISRQLVNLQALEEAGEDFEIYDDDWFKVFREVHRDEINKLSERTKQIRRSRRRR